MARSRNIKPGFFTNDVLGELPPLARLLFAGLWTLCDREGRTEDRPKRIKAEILGYDDCSCDELLESLHKAGFILRYESDGVRVIQVLNWNKHQNPHQKESASTINAPCLSGASPVQEQDKQQPPTVRAGLIPSLLIPDSLYSDADASAGKPAAGKSAEEMAKAELWKAAVAVLQDGGCKSEAACRTFMGKMVGDYTFPVVKEAIEAAIVVQPADAREYIRATCMRLKGERAADHGKPITVPSAAPDKTRQLLEAEAAHRAEVERQRIARKARETA